MKCVLVPIKLRCNKTFFFAYNILQKYDFMLIKCLVMKLLNYENKGIETNG